ncbi:MAG TPA: UDP-N-acetylmuramoyl-L-alanine--D-glutamate ligase [Quisquiliibacterium sp.]|nr:UDP-N-acetylmuramoyl-L-alanine--D-glutamate ligase [Quisquiliibacterium sp.]
MSIDTPSASASAAAPDGSGQLQLFDLTARLVLVVGLGESGLAMARWADFRGARIRVADTREAPDRLDQLRRHVPGAAFVGGALDERLLDGVDLVAWSPGLSTEVGASSAFHAAARARGVPVVGEMELFARALAAMRLDGYQPKVVAITGTNGKTTTTRLVGHLCEQAGRRVLVAGNIAPAALDALRAAIVAQSLPEVWVLELSSFQLALTDSLAPDAAVILNISQDHLDWHASMASYADAKHRIFRGAATCVFNRDDPATAPRNATRTASFGLGLPAGADEYGIAHDGGLRWLAATQPAEEPVGRRRKDPVAYLVKRLMPADALRVRGTHNQANALAALALARAIGIPVAAMLHGLRSFAGEPHRCELIAVVRDVEYYDDSKGTNVGATVAALNGLGRRCLLIVGGEGKGQDFAPLVQPVRDHARAVLLIGRDAPLIRATLADAGVPLVDCVDLDDAVRRAAALAGTGDAVLLSPACASFDMFRNYAHRAEVFAAAVRALAEDSGVPC